MSGLSAADIDALFASLEGYSRLGLAVSGGPDSLALMLLAARWGQGRNIQLFVYTVDHGLRPEAVQEAAMVVREAAAILRERLDGKAMVDTDTARRLFTLICVLHWG